MTAENACSHCLLSNSDCRFPTRDLQITASKEDLANYKDCPSLMITPENSAHHVSSGNSREKSAAFGRPEDFSGKPSTQKMKLPTGFGDK